jgi:hypothetical protein
MPVDEVKKFLKEIKENPSILKDGEDDIDKMLRLVIQIEKKHAFSSEAVSEQRRRDEITKALSSEFSKT